MFHVFNLKLKNKQTYTYLIIDVIVVQVILFEIALFFTQFTRIVLSVHKLIELGKYC